MQFGLFSLMTQRDRSVGAREIYRNMVEHVKLAEQIGFDVAWFAEHHFSNYSLSPSPITLATCLAPQTTRIRLGTAVIVVPLYQPLRMLEDISMLDVISDGRAVIGLGSGYQQYEFHKFGADLGTARDMLLESLDVIEQFFASGRVEYQGEHIRIPETYFSVRPLQRRPDIYIAGLVNDAVTQRRIAENGYVPIVTTGWNRLDQIAQTRHAITAANPRAGGNSDKAPFAMQRYVFVTDRRAEALQAAEGARYIRRIATSMRNRSAKLDRAFLQEEPASDEPPLDEIASRLLVGDAEEVTEKLAREIGTLKPTHISCFMAIPGMPQARVLRSMERFGAEVMPRLAATTMRLQPIQA
jgi:alkanesulfonate monooxygenase SsuD/methylene tetrahydromethanopterin reductase-like flavin-dependent oxidoreductase (luciferase family)